MELQVALSAMSAYWDTVGTPQVRSRADFGAALSKRRASGMSAQGSLAETSEPVAGVPRKRQEIRVARDSALGIAVLLVRKHSNVSQFARVF
jgi:hypothetical protein